MTIVPIRQEESAYPVLWHEHGLEFTADMDFELRESLGEAQEGGSEPEATEREEGEGT